MAEGWNFEDFFDHQKLETEPLPGYHIFKGEEDGLEQFKGNPDYVIRYRDIDILKKELEVETKEDVVAKIREMFEVLRQRYGIEAPVKVNCGKKKVGTKEKLIIYTKRVKRSEKSYSPEDLQKLCESLFRYYREAFESGERFLCDLSSLEQYIYGRIDKNEQDRFILIDTDPWVVQGLDEFVKEMQRLSSTLVTLATQNKFIEDIEKWLYAFIWSLPKSEIIEFIIEDLREINLIRLRQMK